MKTDIISLKKVKKDGSIDKSISKKIAATLRNNELVLLPVDCIYGMICSINIPHAKLLHKYSGERKERLVRLISNFKMLDGIATINKFEFDFLHRVWPDEVTVYLKSREAMEKVVPVRSPKNPFMQEIVTYVGTPLLYGMIYTKDRRHVFRENDVLQMYENKVDLILIIKEFCKDHVRPSVIDISQGDLQIIKEGRIPSEEVKSLFFLGKDDGEL